jgi:hypothetical protein
MADRKLRRRTRRRRSEERPVIARSVLPDGRIVERVSASNGRGRPPSEIDLERLYEECRSSLAPLEWIAHSMGLDPSTLQRRYREDLDVRRAVDRGRADGKLILAKAQIREAVDGNEKLLVHLGKVHLDQNSEAPKVQVNIGIGADYGTLAWTPDELERELDVLEAEYREIHGLSAMLPAVACDEDDENSGSR